MTKISAKVSARISTSLKRFHPILDSARARDVSEADTVTIVKDMLAEVMGYDKYSEVTSEHQIRGTFCDLAVKLDGKLAWLIEVKASGIELKEAHVKQAVDYAANQGCEWVALTNGNRWMVFKVSFAKPIEHHLIADFSLSSLNPRREEDLQFLWLLSKEGWLKSHLDEFVAQQEALSKYTLGAILCSEPVLSLVRREIRRVSPDARVDAAQIEAALRADVIKRELLEGDRAIAAKKMLAKAAKRVLRAVPSGQKEHVEIDIEVGENDADG
jgi:hypothetical protein